MRTLLVVAAGILLATSTACSAPPPDAAFITMSGPGMSMEAIDNVIETAEEGGGHIYHVMPVHTDPGRVLSGACLIGTIVPGHETDITELSNVTGLTRLAVDAGTLLPMGEEAVFAAGAWNYLLDGGGEGGGPPGAEPFPNDALDPLVNGEPLGEGLKSPPQLNALANPGQYQVSEFMIGRVAIGVVLPESTGTNSTEDWSNADPNYPTLTRQQVVYNEIVAAGNWWGTQGGSAAKLTFIYDQRFSVSTTYEPINNSTAGYGEGAWISDVLGNMGYSGSTHWARSYAYINAIRASNSADWATAIFVADSFNDSDGRFPNGTCGFSYMYGPYVVLTYDNATWTVGSMHLVASHEMGHIFGAADEYNQGTYSCPCGNFGYLGVANNNCLNCMTPNVQCIMDFWLNQQVCTFTAGQVGWRDTDSDGKLDPVDCAVGFPAASLNYFSPPWWGSSNIQGQGTAQVTPWTSPTRASVTINKVKVRYNVDGGTWYAPTPTDGAFDSDYEPFTFTTASYADGSHTVTYDAMDNWGNTGTLGTPLSVSIDTSAPPSAPLAASIVEAPYWYLPFCNVNWTAGASDPQSGLFGYRVDLLIDHATPVGSADVQLPVTTCNFTGISFAHGQAYFACVRPLNNAGLTGPDLDSSTMTIDFTPPNPPVAVTDGGTWTTQLNSLSFSWNAATEDVSGIAGYQISVRDDLFNWLVSNKWLGNVTNHTATGLSLTLGRKYFGRVDVQNGAGNWSLSPDSDGIMAVTAYINVSDVKLNATLGSAVGLSGLYVSCTASDAPGNIHYVEQGNQACGIRVDPLVTAGGHPRNNCVDVAGIVTLNPLTQELSLASPLMSTVTGTQTITPLAMINRSVGGSQYGLQPGVIGGSGLNNIGLFVQIVGNVTYVSPSAPYYFVVDDGSAVTDQTGLQGIGCRCGTITPPAQGTTRTVRGICSDENGYPVLLLRIPADWN